MALQGSAPVAAIGSIKAALLAHPLGIAVVGSAIIGVTGYYLATKLLNGDKNDKEELVTE